MNKYVPPPCDGEIFMAGIPVAIITESNPKAIEEWVLKIRRCTHVRVDWHQSGGRAQVLMIGDAAAHARVQSAMANIGGLSGTIHLVPYGASGLHRAGQPAPTGAIAVDLDLGFIVT
jgi:hypothetical protein